MLARSMRVPKKDFPGLLKHPEGKFFCDTHTLLAKKGEHFRFAPVFPRKLKLGSVKQHYWRRITYHAIREVLRKHPDWSSLPIHVILLARQSFLELHFETIQETLEDSLKHLISSIESGQN